MQREIKFRGKHIHLSASNSHLDGRWVYGYLSDINYINSYDLGRELLVDVNTVGEYTRLKDKNTNEIYEGDILSDGVQLWLVRHSETMCGFTATEIVDKKLDYGSCFSLYHLVNKHNCKREVEVIGNIYDNPEL